MVTNHHIHCTAYSEEKRKCSVFAMEVVSEGYVALAKTSPEDLAVHDGFWILRLVETLSAF